MRPLFSIRYSLFADWGERDPGRGSRIPLASPAAAEGARVGAKHLHPSSRMERCTPWAGSAPSRDAALPLHFFTIVLNGEPFIRYHIDVFRTLDCDWHWHVVEGVASLVHDTAWSTVTGGHISPEIHRSGRSSDGCVVAYSRAKRFEAFSSSPSRRARDTSPPAWPVSERGRWPWSSTAPRKLAVPWMPTR